MEALEGGTKGGGVEIIVAQSIFRQGVDVRSFDQSAETAQVSEARVVEQKNDGVRGTGRRLGRGRPPLLGFLVGLGDLALEFLTVLAEGIILAGFFGEGHPANQASQCQNGQDGDPQTSFHIHVGFLPVSGTHSEGHITREYRQSKIQHNAMLD